MAAEQAEAHQEVILPQSGTRRWGARKKAAVVMAIRAGLLAREEAVQRYCLSVEELAFWEAAFDQGGTRALTQKGIARDRRARIRRS